MIDLKINGEEKISADKTLIRIIENERIVTQLEMMSANILSEIDDCRIAVLSREDCEKYGVKMGSLISTVLANFIKLKNLKDDK